ncbi:MAG: sulfatase-like hydrolase/transferase [Planctomycetes bacterium]|nr:sulfatase-like hydrolase/transferase [Planctomycetota bacterium]
MIRFLLCFFALAAAAAAERPNIIVLFADDAGYADFGFQEKPDPAMAKLTPHIDSLAASGLRFTDAYVSGAVCSPSRAGMLTGRYQQRFGHELNIPPGYMDGGMSLEERTIADRLRAAGYATGLIGKWHLGYPEPYQPNKRGFDYFYGLLQGSRSYFPYDKPHAHRVLQENGEPTPETGYVTDRIGEGAVRFIRDHKAKPFFLYVAFTSPHGPLQAKPEDLEACAGIADKKRRTYAAMVKAMDDNIGRILKALDDAGIAENTLVVFTNDNGGQTLTGAVNTPLQGRKGQLWEGGIRVPMCLRWPAAVKAPGRSVADPVITLDLLPTFVGALDRAPEPSWQLDAIDLGPLLTGEIDALPPRALHWRTQGSEGPAAIRVGDDKLVVLRGEEGASQHLFDLANDLGETTDLAAERPELVKQLAGRLADWESELEEPRWGPGSRKR